MSFFLPYQLRWLDDHSPMKIIEKSRQIGMTFTDAFDSVKKCIRKRARFDVWISSRDEAQARLYVEDCAKWAAILKRAAKNRGEIILDDKAKTCAYLLEFKNGRRIYSLSSNPNALAGKRGHVKLDEFALHQDQETLYRVAKPVTQWGGQLCIISTHRGANTLFNRIIRDIKEGRNPMRWSLHSVPLAKAVEEGLAEKIQEKTRDGRWKIEDRRPKLGGAAERPAAASDLRQAWLARLRRECIDEEQWLQEYCCIPADERSAFITFEMIAACEQAGLPLLTFEELVDYCATGVLPAKKLENQDENEKDTQYATRNTADFSHQSTNPLIHQSSLSSGYQLSTINHQLYIGVDIARKHDLCVIDVGEKIGDVIWDRMRIELQNATFAQMEAELYRLLRLRQVKRACIDATGMGTQLAERARLKFGWKVEPVNFTAAVKEELAFGLRADFEEKRLRIVYDEKLSADLRAVKKQVTSSGNLRFDGHAEHSHCDRFWAKALRQHAARQAPKVRAVVG